ncbi:aminopeptidase YpdF [Cutibacterium acnes JCM 18916]|nr:aminopeptidase YpdF [Cutibacterium acnes JCM 18916]
MPRSIVRLDPVMVGSSLSVTGLIATRGISLRCGPQISPRPPSIVLMSLVPVLLRTVFSEEAPAQLVDAGIDCIEHGTGLTDETIATMAEREVGLVPTLINIETFPSIAAQADGKFPKYAAHMRHLHTHRHETIAKLGMPECRFMPVPTLAALSSTASLLRGSVVGCRRGSGDGIGSSVLAGSRVVGR